MRYISRITKGVFIWPYVILSVVTITSCWWTDQEIGRIENEDYRVVATLVDWGGATTTGYLRLDVADLKYGRAVHERTIVRFDEALFNVARFEILQKRLLFMYTAWSDTSSIIEEDVLITRLDDPRIKGIRYDTSPYELDTLYTSSSSNDEYLVTVRQYEGSSQLFIVYINELNCDRGCRGELLFAGVDSVGVAVDDKNILRTIPYWKRKPSDTLYFYVPSFWEKNLVKSTSREALLKGLGR